MEYSPMDPEEARELRSELLKALELPNPMTRAEILDFLQQRREQSQWYDEKNPIEAKDLETPDE